MIRSAQLRSRFSVSLVVGLTCSRIEGAVGASRTKAIASRRFRGLKDGSWGRRQWSIEGVCVRYPANGKTIIGAHVLGFEPDRPR